MFIDVSRRIQNAERSQLRPAFEARLGHDKEDERVPFLLGLRTQDDFVDDTSRFREIAEFLPGIIWLADALTGRIEYVNESYERVLGLSREALYRDADVWLKAVHPEDLASVLAGREVTDETWSCTFRIKGANDEWCWLSSRRNPVFDRSGGVKVLAGYAEDVTQLKELEASVHELGEMLHAAQHDEQRRIARELHDSTGHEIAEVAFTLSKLEQLLPSVDSALQQLFVESRQKLEQCGRSISISAHLSHPPLIEEFGFEGAICQYTAGFSQRTGITVSLALSSSLTKLPQIYQADLFRVIQESLSNVYKHSGSRVVTIVARCKSNVATVRIHDRGRGIPNGILEGQHQGRPLGVGLPGMRERMRLLGGQFDVKTSTKGTIVTASVAFSA